MMSAIQIRAELLRRGVSGAAIARELGLKRSIVSMVITGHRTNPAVRRAIANKLGKPFSEVWGEPDPDAAGRV